MSASLVGSEMCIRDRVGAPRDVEPGVGGMVARLGQACSSSRRCPASPRTCLLYTSDAADDM
eukprot:9116190-Alexandrium_andersonii.AAC.1